MRRAIVWSVVLIILGIIIAACVDDGRHAADVGDEPTFEATTKVDEDSEETTDQGEDANGDGLDINILNIESMPDMNPIMGMINFRTDLEVEIGNSGEETVEFDQVQAIFYQDGQFSSGTKCGLTASDTLMCFYWYEEGDIPPFDEPIKTISLDGHRAISMPLDSGSGFDIDLPGKQLIAIVVIKDGLPIVEALYEF